MTVYRPDHYQKLPDGVKCRCVYLWREVDGSHWCCNINRAPKSADEEPPEKEKILAKAVKAQDDLAIGKKIGEITAEIAAYQRVPTARIRQVLTFLERIGSDGYGGMSEYDVALETVRDLLASRGS